MVVYRDHVRTIFRRAALVAVIPHSVGRGEGWAPWRGHGGEGGATGVGGSGARHLSPSHDVGVPEVGAVGGRPALTWDKTPESCAPRGKFGIFTETGKRLPKT